MRSVARQVEADIAAGVGSGQVAKARLLISPALSQTGMSYHELDERLENDPNIIICWK